LWSGLNQRNINNNLLASFKYSLVGLDDVVARGGSLDFICEISIGNVTDLQVRLQLVLSLIGLGKLEAQLLLRVYLHNSIKLLRSLAY
jgi:hypothetical protein